jgi:hypothetical protein
MAVTTGAALILAGASMQQDAAQLRETLKLEGGAPGTCADNSPPPGCAELRSRLDTGSDLKYSPQGSLRIVSSVTAQQRTVSIAGTW